MHRVLLAMVEGKNFDSPTPVRCSCSHASIPYISRTYFSEIPDKLYRFR